ncbi:MAG: c-type cytochrome [Dyadobacter sp.]|uniref:c-type cytochrome n=1 Tax=Dyadobacter sp. TaxID=1914288 RepID=UPI001B04BE05|nr:c-type cytochrome [Dyadobacter sp.]MBO9616952.1 c-type cytochrome [Dyadobacter sp.]
MKLIYLAVSAAIWSLCAYTKAPETHKQLIRNLSETAVPADKQHVVASEDAVRRGEYLVTVMGCADCHSPKKMTPQGPAPDMDRFLSGYNSAQPLGKVDQSIIKTGEWVVFNGQSTAFAGPWGVSFAANLTPDETGIGTWTFDQFNTAMRKGKFKGLPNTRALLPPMPWPNYMNMTDADMRAVFAYLKSIKPVSNVVPSHIPPGK